MAKKKAPAWLDDDIKEFYNPDDVSIRAIERAIKDKRGEDKTPPYMTIVEHMKKLGLKRPRDTKRNPKETTVSTEQTAAAEIIDEPMNSDGADTAAEVHSGVVHEFDALPDGYAKVIQPMREYTEAEDEALKESIRLFGFIGAIVRDQYGRILDGNQRARVFGEGCPYTKTTVKDDEQAMEIASRLNLTGRHYTQEQREQIAIRLREQGHSYRAIAQALKVSAPQAMTDVQRGEKKAAVKDLTPESVTEGQSVQDLTPDPVSHEQPTNPNNAGTDEPSPKKAPKLPTTITGLDGRQQSATHKKTDTSRTDRPNRNKTPEAAATLLNLEDRLPKIQDQVRDCLSVCRTAGHMRAVSSVLVRCAKMVEDRGRQLEVWPYEPGTRTPAFMDDKTLLDEAGNPPATE